MFKYIDGDFQQGTTTEYSVSKLYILDGGHSEHRVEITKDHLKDIEQLTEENRQKWFAKAGWGLAGALAFGPIGIAAGLFLGGKGKKYSVVCTLSDNRSFMAEVSDDVYKKLIAMKRFGKNLSPATVQTPNNIAVPNIMEYGRPSTSEDSMARFIPDSTDNRYVEIPATIQQTTIIDAEIAQPNRNSLQTLSENCPRCSRKLPSPFQSSGRIVCYKCGWTDQPRKL